MIKILRKIIISCQVRNKEISIFDFFFQEVIHRSKNTLHFIKLHGPWQLLCRYAEELNLRAPIQVCSSYVFYSEIRA